MARRSSEGLAEAEQLFRKAVELDPQFALAHVGLSDVLRLQVTYSGAPAAATLAQAEKSVAEALRLQPDLSEAWASAAANADDRQSFDDAETKFRRAIEINPNNATARHWYSMLLRDSGRLDEARQQIEQAIALDPLSTAMRHALGSVLEAQGRFRESADAYRKAITIDPLQPGSYLMLATLTGYALGRPADAVALVRKALELDPGIPAGVSLLAMLHGELGNRPEALRLTADVVRRWPDFMWAQSMASAVHASAGDWKSAVQSAHKALAIDPQDQTALFVLAAADQLKGEPGAARARYVKAHPDLLGTDPPRIDAGNFLDAVGLASLLLQTGEDARAQPLLDGSERAMRQMPRLSLSGYGIADAQVHALRGDKAKALAALREAANAGWRGPFWRYYRDIDPTLASIRHEPGFRAAFADIERDMERQRAELGAQQ
jgi:tetratricopeptide (TPR) repeat protein